MLPPMQTTHTISLERLTELVMAHVRRLAEALSLSTSVSAFVHDNNTMPAEFWKALTAAAVRSQTSADIAKPYNAVYQCLQHNAVESPWSRPWEALNSDEKVLIHAAVGVVATNGLLLSGDERSLAQSYEICAPTPSVVSGGEHVPEQDRAVMDRGGAATGLVASPELGAARMRLNKMESRREHLNRMLMTSIASGERQGYEAEKRDLLHSIGKLSEEVGRMEAQPDHSQHRDGPAAGQGPTDAPPVDGETEAPDAPPVDENAEARQALVDKMDNLKTQIVSDDISPEYAEELRVELGNLQIELADLDGVPDSILAQKIAALIVEVEELKEILEADDLNKDERESYINDLSVAEAKLAELKGEPVADSVAERTTE